MDKSEQILELIKEMKTDIKEEFKNVRNEIKDVRSEINGVSNEMQDGFKDVNNKFDGLQAEMQEGLREAYNERQEIKMIIENDVTKNINLLVEGQENLNTKIDEVLKFKDEKEMLTIRIEILENELERMKARLDEIA